MGISQQEISIWNSYSPSTVKNLWYILERLFKETLQHSTSIYTLLMEKAMLCPINKLHLVFGSLKFSTFVIFHKATY